MKRLICRLLIVALAMLPFQGVQAGMVGTVQAVSAATASSDRHAVLSMISRSEVAGQLQAMGVDPKAAGERIAAMTDEEIHGLANRIDSLPAGANSNGWGWAAAILIAVLIWYNWKR